MELKPGKEHKPRAGSSAGPPFEPMFCLQAGPSVLTLSRPTVQLEIDSGNGPRLISNKVKGADLKPGHSVDIQYFRVWATSWAQCADLEWVCHRSGAVPRMRTSSQIRGVKLELQQCRRPHVGSASGSNTDLKLVLRRRTLSGDMEWSLSCAYQRSLDGTGLELEPEPECGLMFCIPSGPRMCISSQAQKVDLKLGPGSETQDD
ncbi:hypothetical protein chiPu_0017246 [Chiloscyllium punctatum]|uniref:Uncharacterized protein n=1 Tax=Chiloscyllium punctatum TaxID=137246 RepID=A0A401T7W4_CHIPU|nr:hypothetical protein [Chiloscyllium punctatum]